VGAPLIAWVMMFARTGKIESMRQAAAVRFASEAWYFGSPQKNEISRA
jgi:hypothetical protein